LVVTADNAGATLRAVAAIHRIRDLARGLDVCERCTVADRPLLRMRGLLGRSDLPPDEGVLLRPASSIHTYGMRFSIDALFLDSEMRVVDIRSEVGPWRVASKRGAQAILELRAGEARKREVGVGDVLSLVTLEEN